MAVIETLQHRCYTYTDTIVTRNWSLSIQIHYPLALGIIKWIASGIFI